jgi:hypothetical protein
VPRWASSAVQTGCGFRRRWQRQPLTITTMDPDHEASANSTVILLERLWHTSGERLAARCRGLAHEELLWEPVEDSWNLVPDAAHPGGLTYPYDLDPPHPIR